MNFNLGKFEILQGATGWYVTRNGDPMNSSFGSRDEALNYLKAYIAAEIDRILLNT